jgi:hypothetical protein
MPHLQLPFPVEFFVLLAPVLTLAMQHARAERLFPTVGLKLGIYLNNGKWTCQHYAGSEGYLAEDVRTIAGWKVDGLKLDGCYMGMDTYNRVNDS